MGGQHGLALNAGMVYLVDFAIHIYMIPVLANTAVYLMYRTQAGIVYLSAMLRARPMEVRALCTSCGWCNSSGSRSSIWYLSPHFVDGIEDLARTPLH